MRPSLVGHAGLAQGLEESGDIRMMIEQILDREVWIGATSLLQDFFRLEHLVLRGVGGRETDVSEELTIAKIESLVVVLSGNLEMSQAKLGVAQKPMPTTDAGIPRTEPHGLQDIGFGLPILTQV